MALETPHPPPVKPARVNSAGPERGELGSVTCLVLWGLLPWQGNLKETSVFVGQSRQGAPARQPGCPRPFRGYCSWLLAEAQAFSTGFWMDGSREKKAE